MTHFFPIQPQCLRVPQDQKSLQPTFLLLLILIFVSVKIFVKKKVRVYLSLAILIWRGYKSFYFVTFG